MRPLRKRVQKILIRKRDSSKEDWKVARWKVGKLGGGYTPHYIHECQNKGDKKWAIRKRMKTREGRKFGGDSEKGLERVGVKR